MYVRIHVGIGIKALGPCMLELHKLARFCKRKFFHFSSLGCLACASTQTLLLVGCLPFATSLNTTFSDNLNSDNEILSIRVTSVLVFLLGLSQLVVWTIALNSK